MQVFLQKTFRFLAFARLFLAFLVIPLCQRSIIQSFKCQDRTLYFHCILCYLLVIYEVLPRVYANTHKKRQLRLIVELPFYNYNMMLITSCCILAASPALRSMEISHHLRLEESLWQLHGK